MLAHREVRIRPAYAALYPGLPVNEWMLARPFAEAIAQRASHARSLSIHRRTLEQQHFEFRGGASEVRSARARGRPTDARGSEST